jgi:FimV-like protein
MIPLIIKSYFLLLISIVAGSLLIFAAGLYFIFKKNPPAKKIKNNFANDFSAIAGEDVVTTQLDLARAYLETGKSFLAAEILNNVIKQGNAIQRAEAQQLMKSL